MLVRLTSKFDVRRLCQATGATVLPALNVPTTEELGYIECVRIDEIADTNVVIFEQGSVFLSILEFRYLLIADYLISRLKQKVHGDTCYPRKH